jgi:HK97 family phage major capsid protein
VTTATPDAPEALLEALHAPGWIQANLKSPDDIAKFAKDYAGLTNAKDPSIPGQVNAQITAANRDLLMQITQAGDSLRSAQDGIKRLNLDPDQVPGRRAGKLYNRYAPGAKVEALKHKRTETWADYMGGVYHRFMEKGTQASVAEIMDFRSKLTEVANSFGSNVPADGGFLIPERLRADLLRVSLETALMRRFARTVPMDSLTVPFPTLDSTSNVSSVHGGITAYWTEEGQALTESDPTFGRVVLQARKLTARADVPNELFQDSIISLEAFISEVFPDALAWFEDTAFITGDGVGKPLGWMNADAMVDQYLESTQDADTIVWQNILHMYARMLPSSLGRAIWVANIDTFPELAQMALSVGTGGSAIWLNNGQVGPPMTILGRPVYFTEKVPSIAARGGISFIDPGYYLIGDRQTMRAETSAHYRFANDITTMRFIQRLDGQPWIAEAITPQNGLFDLSPFVTLNNQTTAP